MLATTASIIIILNSSLIKLLCWTKRFLKTRHIQQPFSQRIYQQKFRHIFQLKKTRYQRLSSTALTRHTYLKLPQDYTHIWALQQHTHTSTPQYNPSPTKALIRLKAHSVLPSYTAILLLKNPSANMLIPWKRRSLPNNFEIKIHSRRHCTCNWVRYLGYRVVEPPCEEVAKRERPWISQFAYIVLYIYTRRDVVRQAFKTKAIYALSVVNQSALARGIIHVAPAL